MDVEQRFLRHVHKTDGCWLWTASFNRQTGYGWFQLGRGIGAAGAHRVAYELWIGPVGEACVLHRCDTRLCVRPDHLFLGTRTENMDDKVAKRRQHRRFTDDQIRIFRERRRAGERLKDLAAEYEMSYSNAKMIMRGDLYAYVD